jgi:hypothetical protein
MIPTDCSERYEHTADVVELRLLLPARQAAALEAEAGRLDVTVAALVGRAIDDFLRAPGVVGFVGEVPGRPTAPLPEDAP